MDRKRLVDRNRLVDRSRLVDRNATQDTLHRPSPLVGGGYGWAQKALAVRMQGRLVQSGSKVPDASTRISPSRGR